MIKKIIYKFKIIYYKKIIKKDIMELKVQMYREKGVKIGNNMRTFSPLISAEPYLLEFGHDVTISTGVKFTTHDNSIGKVVPNATDIFGRIKIGNNCFIGQNTLILLGIELADNIIVAAGSVVTKSFKEKGIIIAGNPARKIGEVNRLKDKYEKYALNTIGLNENEKKEYLFNNEQYFIKK